MTGASSDRRAGAGPRCWVVVPAAGSGNRMGEVVAKQYLPLAGHPLIHWAIKPFLDESRVDGVVVVLARGDRQWPDCAPPDAGKRIITTTGGSERCESVRNGLEALAGMAADSDWVLVHDAARPCLGAGDLDCLLGRLWEDEIGGLLAVPVRDTLKLADRQTGLVDRTVPREQMWLASTPQMFRFGLLRKALDQCMAAGVQVTDESAAMEYAGHSPKLIECHWENLKVTYPHDLVLAEMVLEKEQAS